MDVKNCKNCGRLFNYIAGPPLCPACKEDLEKMFQKAKEYIRNTAHCTVQMVSEECEIPENLIKQWVREERLVFTDGMAAGILCENCGEPITTGRFCAKCKNEMMSDLNGAIKKPEAPQPQKKTKDSPRMRFLDNR